MPRLLIIEGDDQRSVDLGKGKAFVGRATENEICILDGQASRKHAQIEWTGSGYKLIDLESGNGTRVNGARVNQKLLALGDVILIGVTHLIFQDPMSELMGDKAPPPPASEVTPAPPPPRPVPPVRPATRKIGPDREKVLEMLRVEKERRIIRGVGIAAAVLIGLFILFNVVPSFMRREPDRPSARPPVPEIPAVVPAPPPPRPPDFAEEKERILDALRREKFADAIRDAGVLIDSNKSDPARYPEAVRLREDIVTAASEFVKTRREEISRLPPDEARKKCDDALGKLGAAEPFREFVDLLKKDRP